MNNKGNGFIKTILIIVAILVVLGMILGGIGWAFGGKKEVVDMALAGELQYGPVKLLERVDHDGDEFERMNEIGKGAVSGKVEDSNVASKNAVTSLEISIGGGEFYIKESPDDNFQIKSNTDQKYQYYIEENTLVIYGLNSHNNYAINNEINLYIPKNMFFEEVDIELGGALSTIENIKAQEIDMMVGAGKINLNAMETQEFSLEVGAGEVILENADVQHANIDLAVGRIYYKGSITGDLDVNSGMGSMELDLTGSYEDHNYEVEGGIGNIKIGRSQQVGVAMSKSIHNNQNSTFELECGVGNIDIRFEK